VILFKSREVAETAAQVPMTCADNTNSKVVTAISTLHKIKKKKEKGKRKKVPKCWTNFTFHQ